MAVKKGKNQTEETAKGLLKNVGNYKGKTLNLTKKQLGKSGAAAASQRKIAISKTRYDEKSKKVLGPMGKPITGRVDLGGGNIAVYKNGVRVKAASPSSKSKAGTTDKTGSPQPKTAGYEERKGRVGAMTPSASARTAGSVQARQGKMGSMTLPGGNAGRIDRRKGSAAKPDAMDAPSRSGKTKPMPGVTAMERRYNQSKTARRYPSRRVVEAQEKRLGEAMLIASLLPGVGIVGRAARGAKAVASATKALPRGGSSGGYRAAQMGVTARKTPRAVGGRKTPRAIEGPKKK